MGTIYTGLKSRDLSLPSSNPAQLVTYTNSPAVETYSVTTLRRFNYPGVQWCAGSGRDGVNFPHSSHVVLCFGFVSK